MSDRNHFSFCMEPSVFSTIHPVQSSRSDGSFMKRSSVEVLRISEISENSESAEVGDTVVGETSLITRSQERHRINKLCKNHFAVSKSVWGSWCRKEDNRKVTWFFWSPERIAGWRSEESKKRSDGEDGARAGDEMKKIREKSSERERRKRAKGGT